MIAGYPISLEIGVSVVHPHDQFCRKVGLALATSRLKLVHFLISHICRDEGDIIFTLVGEGYILELLYDFRTKYPKIQDIRIMRNQLKGMPYGTQIPASE
jgi:hypothetical protein